MKESLSTRENVQRKNLNFLRRVSLDIEPGHRFHQLCNLEMEVSETSFGHYLSTAIINVEIDTEQDFIELIFFSYTARVIGSEVLLILSLQAFYCLILSGDTEIIEVVRGISIPEVLIVDHGHSAIGYLLALFGNIDSLLNTIIVDDTYGGISEPLELLTNDRNVLAITRVHDSAGNPLSICLIESILYHEVVVVLVEVKVVHKIGGKQVVHESNVCQVMRESQNSSQKYP